MVANRESIAVVGSALADMVLKGGGNSAQATELAVKLERLCANVGTYQKRYESHEERVLHRHLNLYINKRDKAATAAEKDRWQAKAIEQQARIAEFEAERQDGRTGLDLEGL